MTYLNQFHKQAVERKMQKIIDSLKLPMNSVDAANYMKRNFEQAKAMLQECTGARPLCTLHTLSIIAPSQGR